MPRMSPNWSCIWSKGKSSAIPPPRCPYFGSVNRSKEPVEYGPRPRVKWITRRTILPMTKLAIIDIGTNSIHMVLAEVEPDFSYKILDRFKDMTRLGDGVFKTGRLSDQAMVRGLEVLRSLDPGPEQGL